MKKEKKYDKIISIQYAALPGRNNQGEQMMGKRVISLFLAAVFCISIFAGCKSSDSKPSEEQRKIREPEYLTLFADGESDYTIVRPEIASAEVKACTVKLRNAFKDKFADQRKPDSTKKDTPTLGTDWIQRGQELEEGLLEILIGNTNREETRIVRESLDGEMYAVAALNGKIVIYGTTDEYLDAAVDYFIKTYITPAETTVTIEKTTNEIAVKSGEGWLMARTLGIEIAGTSFYDLSGTTGTLEVVAYVDADDYEDVGFTVTMNSAQKNDEKYEFGGLEYKGGTYTAGGVTYNAADRSKKQIVSAKIEGVDAGSLVKLDIVPTLKKFGETYFGLSSFVCGVNGQFETINTVEQKDGTYQIANAAELFAFASYINAGHRAANASLTADIDLAGIKWNPVGSAGMSFKGSFNGNGHRISNLYLNSENTENLGFFGCVGSSSTVEKITFENAYLFANGNKSAGIVAGENRGLIRSCVVNGVVSTTDRDNAASGSYKKKDTMGGIGGIVGTLNGKYLTSVEDSEFSGKIDLKADYLTFVGGIAGRSLAISGDIVRCVNSADIIYDSAYNTENSKTVTGLGGLAGSIVNGQVFASVNRGNITGRGKTVGIEGGLVGNITGMGQVVDSWNEGNVKAEFTPGNVVKGYAGGIVGAFSETLITDGLILRCYNKGQISSVESVYTGGILGLNNECRSYVYYSYNVGDVVAKTYAGGIVGGAGSTKTFIMNCYNAGKLSGEHTGGIVGYAFSSFAPSYSTKYFKDDIFVSYRNNCYLDTYSADAYRNSSKDSQEGASADIASLCANVMSANELSPNNVKAFSYFVNDSKNINGGLPVFEYQNDKSKADPKVDTDLYIVHSETIEPDGSRWYMANRYTDKIREGRYIGGEDSSDRRINITVAEFEAGMDDMTGPEHDILDENDKIVGHCTCSVFGEDHYFTINKWKDLLDDVNNNLQGVADWANRGEIRYIGNLIADKKQSSGSVAVTWRLTNDSTTLSINFNVIYYKNERCDGATVHEMAHSQLLDGPCESWVAEGNADYVKHNYYEGTDMVNYTWKAEDVKEAYTPTATCMSWLSRQYGFETARIALTFDTVLGGNTQKGWEMGFGAKYEDVWTLFGKAGKYNKTAYFED